MRGGGRLLLRVSLAIALLLLAWRGSAEAHTGGTTGFAAVTISGQAIRYTLTLSLDALQRAKVDPTLIERVPLSADYGRARQHGRAPLRLREACAYAAATR